MTSNLVILTAFLLQGTAVLGGLALWRRHRAPLLGVLALCLAGLWGVLGFEVFASSDFPLLRAGAVALFSLATVATLAQLLDHRATEAEERLRISEARFSKAFHASPDAVTLSTLADGKFQEVNDGFTTITGYSREETLGRTSADLDLWVHPKDRATLVAGLDRDGQVRDLETVFRRNSGELRHCRISADVLEIEGEASLLFLVRDITHRKRAEAERLAIIAELEGKNAELERFVYTISHDLRSPLVTIQGFLGFLEKDVREGNKERLEKDFERIRRAVSTMQQLLDELLQLSRIGRVINPPVSVDMNQMVRRAVDLSDGSLRERGVEVVLAEDLPPAVADAPRLLEVIQNLVENAVKFMGSQEHPQIEIGFREEEELGTVYFVRDNGMGIDRRYQERIFGLFERLSQEVPGTGIGLALVKRIIEVHGGQVWVESEGENCGSTFCFTLATEDASVVTSTEPPGSESPEK